MFEVFRVAMDTGRVNLSDKMFRKVSKRTLEIDAR